MKILFAIKNINEAKGGAERVLSQISSGLAGRGHEVIIVSCEPEGGQSYYPLSDKIRRICLGIGDSMRQAVIGETWQRIRAIRRILKEEQPDVVIGFMHSLFIPVSLAALGTGIPVIASEHIVPAHYKTRPVQFALLVLSSFLVKRITVLSNAVSGSYPAVMRHKMVVIPNPVSLPDQKSAPPESERRTILNVGRLDAQKDQKTLIQAFARLAHKYPDWDVKIFGEGPLQKPLQDLIDNLGLQGRVFLMGTTRQIEAQYAAADIFAMPSKYESFGLATAEAMSYGVPAIGFLECPGTNEIIADRLNGLLVSKKGTEPAAAFAAGLEQLIADPALRQRLGTEARKGVLRYKPEAVTTLWEDLIKKTAA